MGIEPVTTRCLVAVLTTKLLGRTSEGDGFSVSKPTSAVPNLQAPASTETNPAGQQGRTTRRVMVNCPCKPAAVHFAVLKSQPTGAENWSHGRPAVPSGRVKKRALPGTHHAGKSVEKTLVGWRHVMPQVREACGIFSDCKWGEGRRDLPQHIKSVLLFERVRPRSQSESKAPGSSAAESTARRPRWFLFSILICSSAPVHALGNSWCSSGWKRGLVVSRGDVAGPLAAGGEELTPADAAPPGWFGGGCRGGLVARAVAAGTRIATEGAERW